MHTNIKMDFEEIKRKDEMKELYDFEQKITANANSNEKTFEIYGLLNNEWIEKYKNKYNYNLYLQKGQFNNNFSENIFIIDDLLPKFENLELDYDKQKIEINYNNNFALVSIKFINLITKNFKNEEREKLLNLCYKAIKTINGLIIIEKEEKIILFYKIFEGKNIFKIKYILKYSKEDFMNKELNLILKGGLKNYKKIRNIESSKQTIYNNNGEKIGYFYSSLCQISNNLKMNFNNRNEIHEVISKEKLYLLNHSKLNSIFLCLYQIEDLKQAILANNDVNQNEAMKILSEFITNFQTLKKESFNKIQSFFKSKIPRTYSKTISIIFNELNPKKNNENKNALDSKYNQALQYGNEKEVKELFLKNIEKDSIIQNLFYCIKEKIITCSNCNLKVYKFVLLRFLLIKDKISKKIQDIIFKVINKEDNIKCNFCSGDITDCNIISKITDFPKILIIILEKVDISEFNLKENLNIVNGNIKYTLICLIDQGQDNKVYFKKGNVWNLYDENYDEQKVITLDNIKPIVLFYELERNNVDNHTSSINKNNLNINKNNNFNISNNINNNYNNISNNSNRQNFMSNTMNYGIMNKNSLLTNINGCNIYPNNINQNNMKKFDNVNLMNNSNFNFQKYNINNINNINNNFNNQQNFTNNFNMNNSNNIILNNKNNINNNQNHQRSQSSYNNKKNYMNNTFNRVNNNLNFNMNNNMIFNMMSSNMNNNINSNNYNNLNINMKNNINNNMNNQFNINNNVNINNNGNMNGNAINNILNNNHNNNMVCRSMDFKMMKNNNNNGFNNNMINNINYNWNNNNNNHMINNITNNIHVINNMNGGNIINTNNNSNNPCNNTNNNKNNESGHNNHNNQITNNSNNNNPNNQNLQSKNLNNKNNNNNNLIFLTFTFQKYNKQIFIDVLDNILFSQVIKELQDKYAWLKKIKKKLYYFEGIELNENKNIKEYGIKDNSDITVII